MAIVERGNHLRIYVRNDMRRIGRGFALGGLCVGVPFAILGIVGSNLPHDWVLLGSVGGALGVIGGVFALVGVLCWLPGKRSVEVDTAARTLLFPDGDGLGFDDVATVAMLSYVHETRTEEQVCYQVAVVGPEVDHDAKVEIETIRESIDPLAGDEEPTAEEKEAVEELKATMHERLERMRPLLGRAGRSVLDHSSVLVSWQVAERLAKVLDVPLLDLAGERFVERTPAELDLSLRDRAKRQGLEPPDPGPAPAGIEAASTSRGYEIQWKGPDLWAGLAWVFALGFAVQAAFSLFDDETFPETVRVTFLLLTGLAVAAGVLLRVFKSSHRLVLDRRRVLFLRRGHRTLEIPLHELEAVRISADLRNHVFLLSDRAAFDCVLEEEEQARWIALAVERFVITGRP